MRISFVFESLDFYKCLKSLYTVHLKVNQVSSSSLSSEVVSMLPASQCGFGLDLRPAHSTQPGPWDFWFIANGEKDHPASNQLQVRGH